MLSGAVSHRSGIAWQPIHFLPIQASTGESFHLRGFWECLVTWAVLPTLMQAGLEK